ncbi:signal peptidase I [Candidatus Methylospira mobilis]|uniref:Signal peptidase I n=1 Tax=Candidatus Methylospira mobilis TaxID=1808979 RepID=A0A5Q0BGF6_9GAMM|nr:signal peptidase I [Candidatus Methylospira mobilis]QFY42890.1 signal peptidase I [Candidatus Methylospira mobilis]WNV04051.1 signal peptidase I [Candidatus Methylospira mobilis]
MNVDFSLVLVLGSIGTGLIWGGYLFWSKLRGPDSHPVQEPVIVEYARSFFPVIFIVLLLRSFLVEPFRIPSGSMMPTLLIGDFILVNKFTYGIRLPVLHDKVIELNEPKRGDIVVFRFPKDPSVDYIKRVIGLPGDRIGYHDKQLFINGERVEATPLGVYQGKGKGETMSGALTLSEDLGNVSHDILIRQEQPSVQGDFTVPEGRYFVMGDNRDNSNDSRYWGTVPEENLVGRAFFIWMSWDLDNGGVAWNRLGTLVK